MKYAILMPYFNRLEQLKRTLISFQHHYGGRDDWRVVILLDRKEKEPDLVRVMVARLGMITQVTIVDSPGDGSDNTPTREYNFGVAMAHADFVFPTNPECLHKVNALAICDDVFAQKPDAYIVCACEAVGNVSMAGDFDSLVYAHKDWYQHSKFHNRMLNFCTAISTASYWKIGGFDNEYAVGLGYADDAFRDAVIAAGLPIVLRDDALTLHQEHPITNIGDRHRLVAMNRAIYDKKREVTNAKNV